ncbi:MAG: phage holin family protein [Candidatus Binatia bacterium]
MDLAALALRWLVNALALWLTSIVMPGIETAGVAPTLLAALVLGILNALLRPILVFLTLPITILTLGLFTLVINAAMLMLTARLVDGFAVSGFVAAFFGALVLSIISVMLSLVAPGRGAARIEIVYRR